MGGKWTPEQRRTYYIENRERILQERREFRALNRDRIRASDRARYRPERMQAWRLLAKHGMRAEEWAAMWQAQDGRCYLCGDPLDAAKAVIDHDHSCCPAEQTCRICRRGLAHADCNSSIGMAKDDPDRLRRMADALESAQREVMHRKAASGTEQLLLIE